MRTRTTCTRPRSIEQPLSVLQRARILWPKRRRCLSSRQSACRLASAKGWYSVDFRFLVWQREGPNQTEKQVRPMSRSRGSARQDKRRLINCKPYPSSSLAPHLRSMAALVLADDLVGWGEPGNDAKPRARLAILRLFRC